MADRKTETLNLRVDEKLEFAVEFASRAADKTKTKFAEVAMRTAADAVKDPAGKTWRDYWDPSLGVRELSLIRWAAWDTDVEEDRRAEFIQAHWVFFFEDIGRAIIWRAAADVLWPDVEEHMRRWFDSRRADYFGVGHAMAKQLTAAGLDAPQWPMNKIETAL